MYRSLGRIQDDISMFSNVYKSIICIYIFKVEISNILVFLLRIPMLGKLVHGPSVGKKERSGTAAMTCFTHKGFYNGCA